MFTLNLQAGCRYLPNREMVTVYYRSPASTQLVPHAKRVVNDVAEKEPSDGAYQVQRLGFLLPSDEVVGEPQPGDYIEDANGGIYTVLDAGEPAMQSTWRLACQRLRIEDLGHTVTIYLPQDSIDSRNSPITTLPAAPEGLTDVRAAIQQTSNEVVEYQGRKGTRYHYSIWTYIQTDVPLGTVIVDETNQRYKVTGSSNRTRIDELLKITCVIDP